jgi:tight adherence protein C
VTRAVLAAGLAGVLAAYAVFDLAAVVAGRRVRRRWTWLGVLARIGRPAGGRVPVDLDARVAAAGVDLASADVMAMKAGAALAGAAAALVALPLAPGRTGIALAIGAPAAGFGAPDLWLRRRARERGRRMSAELADVVDLLRVAIAAGLSPARAAAEVGRRHTGVLAAELRKAAAARALGAPGHAVLDQLERRCPAPGVTALAAALRRAERHGAPPAPALAALAAEARAAEARRRMEAAARAGPQIQLVVALLLVPAVLALVAAALVPALTGGT